MRTRVHRARARRARAALLPLALACALPAAAAAAAGAGGAEAPTSPTAPGTATFAVGLRVLRLVDSSRTLRLRDGRRTPRTLVTYVRYPATVAPGAGDGANVPAASSADGFPLVVFAHGFAATPSIYSRLLDSWARAGYVVAAPVFPLESAHAPGGPDESDLVNEPADMSFVISRVLAEGTTGTSPLAGIVDPTRVAVAGQSDGGIAALATAYGRRFADPRVRAAVILSGAEMSGVGGYRFPRSGRALLAVQGTADTSNEPRFTYAYFAAARRPKFLLRLLGAGHLPPYTREQPQLQIVERVTRAFLDAYVKGGESMRRPLTALGDVPALAALTADP